MKLDLLIFFLVATLFGCSSTNKNIIAGVYQTPTIQNDYWQRVKLTPAEQYTKVEITASLIKGYPNCEFMGKGYWNEGKLIVPLGKIDGEMFIQPLAKNAIRITASQFEQRFQLMWFCGGGATLAGDYVRQ